MITVDREFEALVRPLSADERERLEASLLAEGLREALVVWNGVLLDGHNRYRICQENEIPVRTVEVTGVTSRDEALVWIVNNQLSRRNLEAIERVALLEKRRDPLERAAKARQATSAPGVYGGKPARQNFSQPVEDTGRVNTTLAREAGVSRPTYEALAAVNATGTDEVKQAVRESRVGAQTAAEIASLPEEEQREVVSAGGRKEILADLKSRTAHVANNSGENEWYTPADIIFDAVEVLGEIDTDPASCAAANETVQAKVFYTAEDDGLSKEWIGKVWLNPPYARGFVGQFINKLIESIHAGHTTGACVLVNNSTESAWGQLLLAQADAVCFLAGRVAFIDKAGVASGKPLQGQIVAYFGADADMFEHVFKERGVVFCAEA